MYVQKGYTTLFPEQRVPYRCIWWIKWSPVSLPALKSIKKNTSRWYELHLHNYVLISSLFIITLVVIIRAVIHSAAVQATGNKVNRQGQKSVQMFPGNKMFLCVESSNSISIAFKSCPLHNCSYVTGQKDSVRDRFSNWPYVKIQKHFVLSIMLVLNPLMSWEWMSL